MRPGPSESVQVFGTAQGPVTQQMEFCARSCHYCRDACSAAIVHTAVMRGARPFPEMREALAACRELLRITEESLLAASPAHILMCQSCNAACTLCGRACDAMNVLLAAASSPDPVIKEVGDTCWIAASVCKELVASGLGDRV